MLSMPNMKIHAFADEASPMIDAQIAAMVRNGLDGLEIRNVDEVNVSDITLEKAAEVRAKLDAAGLTVWSIGSPLGKINIETDDFEEHLEKVRHTLKVAEILGAKRIRIFSFYIPDGKDPAEYKDEVIDRLRRMAAIAEHTGITLCHENEKGIYGDNADRCWEILTAVPQLRGVFDPANFVQCGEDPMRAWDLLSAYIDYMHIKDAKTDGANVPAGKGAGHIPMILPKYFTQGGRAVTLEPHLSAFVGLGALEREGERSTVGGLNYANADEAFDAGVAALKAILGEK